MRVYETPNVTIDFRLPQKAVTPCDCDDEKVLIEYGVEFLGELPFVVWTSTCKICGEEARGACEGSLSENPTRT